jgi:hypothetical protein
LEESPFVDVMGDRQLETALQAAGLPSRTNLTPDIGRKICVRTGSKARLQGAISRQGGDYQIDLRLLLPPGQIQGPTGLPR